MKPEPSIFDDIDQAAEDAADAEALADHRVTRRGVEIARIKHGAQRPG